LSTDSATDGRTALARLLFGGALVWVSFALLLNPWTVGVSASVEVLTPESLQDITRGRVLGGLLALCFCLLGFVARRRARGQLFTRTSLLLLFGVSPVVMVELGWAPYCERPSKLFEAHESLGWRLRADTETHWLGVPQRINSMGLRGPERSHRADEGTRRVLFLGDSVVFGFRIEDDADTLPAQLEACLEAGASQTVEVINAGVDGWSPWQEAEWLRTEGARYEPDVVVMGFVLNDVTEKLRLVNFGGEDVGFQLRNSRTSGIGGWLASTAWANLLRELSARFDVGESARQAAIDRELLSVYDLIRSPNDRRVRAAWELTLPNVDAIRAWCAERGVPLLIAAFPYTVQLYSPQGQDLGAPQARLASFCRERDLPMVDLREPLITAMQSRGLTEYDLYMDAIHPHPLGYAIIAEHLCKVVAELGWLNH
jgi:lysophospholipase L1-like esterase